MIGKRTKNHQRKGGGPDLRDRRKTRVVLLDWKGSAVSSARDTKEAENGERSTSV